MNVFRTCTIPLACMHAWATQEKIDQGCLHCEHVLGPNVKISGKLEPSLVYPIASNCNILGDDTGFGTIIVTVSIREPSSGWRAHKTFSRRLRKWTHDAEMSEVDYIMQMNTELVRCITDDLYDYSETFRGMNLEEIPLD